jgi:hypothetical protein
MPNKCDGVAKLKKLEQRLDRRFSVFGVQVGTDGLIGLIPVAGDVLTAITGAYIIFQARKLGAERATVMKMAGNLAVDLVLGCVPVVGDIFDIAFRSNTRNVKLLIADLEQRAVELREVNREQRLAVAA